MKDVGDTPQSQRLSYSIDMMYGMSGYRYWTPLKHDSNAQITF